ncbi:MAG: CHRD domain-containing protein [Bacteroidota bacterium]|nr:CHRD domain-containing protein [Bacteroidota bacterium]
MMKNIIIIASLILCAYVASCTKGGEQDGFGNTYIYTSNDTASYTQVVPAPAVDTLTAGSVTSWYDDQAKVLNYTVKWYGLWKLVPATKNDTIVSISIYKGDAGSNGTLVRTLKVSITSSKTSNGSMPLCLAGTTYMTESEKADYLAGKWYILIASKKKPAGIIRGQMNVVKR